MKAIVIGAGIGGLCAAIGLRRLGWDVCVFERAKQLAEVGAGISIWCNALHALDLLGAGKAVRRAYQPMSQCELRAKQGRRVVGAFDVQQLERLLGMAPAVGMIHRAELVDVLVICCPTVPASSITNALRSSRRPTVRSLSLPTGIAKKLTC